MKMLFIPAIAGAFLLSACAPNELLQKQENEYQAMAGMHKAERKEVRAEKTALAASATAAAAAQNARAARHDADAAREAFYQSVCPVDAD